MSEHESALKSEEDFKCGQLIKEQYCTIKPKNILWDMSRNNPPTRTPPVNRSGPCTAVKGLKTVTLC